METFDFFCYQVTAELHENKLSVNFTIFDSDDFRDCPPENMDPLFTGYIKWGKLSNT
jgi:hypothetical protein